MEISNEEFNFQSEQYIDYILDNASSGVYHFLAQLSRKYTNEDNYIINTQTKDYVKTLNNIYELIPLAISSIKKYLVEAIELNAIVRLPDKRLVLNPLLNKRMIKEIKLFNQIKKETK